MQLRFFRSLDILITLFQDSFIIDNGMAGIWVWVGKKASHKERTEAMRNAQGFIKKKNYPNHTQVTRVIDGGEPQEFKSLFNSWATPGASKGLGKTHSVGKIGNHFFLFFYFNYSCTSFVFMMH